MTDTKMDISFILPTLNEEAHIGGVIDTIRENVEGRYKYEVIVVDNGSRDRTLEIAAKKGALCFCVPGCSISTLRNKGAEEAKSVILVFIDGDVYLGKEWGRQIDSVIKKLHRRRHLITGSIYGISEENNWIERIWFAPRTTTREVRYINGGHLIIHRDVFDKLHGFDPTLETGEDYDLCVRGKTIGTEIENDPDLKVMHAGYPKTVRRFFGRERWHARGDCVCLKRLLSSKPAIISLANLGVVVTCSIGTALSTQLWMVYLLFYVAFLTGVSLCSTIYRSRGRGDTALLGSIFLYMVYFTARTVAIVDVALRKVTGTATKT